MSDDEHVVEPHDDHLVEARSVEEPGRLWVAILESVPIEVLIGYLRSARARRALENLHRPHADLIIDRLAPMLLHGILPTPEQLAQWLAEIEDESGWVADLRPSIEAALRRRPNLTVDEFIRRVRRVWPRIAGPGARSTGRYSDADQTIIDLVLERIQREQFLSVKGARRRLAHALGVSPNTLDIRPPRV